MNQLQDTNYDTPNLVPWEHYVVDDFLPRELLKKLSTVQVISNNKNSNGTRTNVSGRYFFTPDKKDDITISVVKFFKDNVHRFQNQFGYDLSDSYLRIELAQDDQDFWQECHLDTLEKRITMIVFLERDDETVNLGTDLYYTQDGDYIRSEWKDNRCLVFKPTEETWHAFGERQFKGKRRVLLINFVDTKQWLSKDQVWDL